MFRIRMRYFWIFFCFINSGFLLNAQSDLTIGMSIEEVIAIYPKCKISNNGDKVALERSETLYGIDGEWGYGFVDDSLYVMHYSKYVDKIDYKNFNKCFAWAKSMILDYTAKYGEPDTIQVGVTNFVDPAINMHWGYDVFEAKWYDHQGMKIKIEFTFFGGKGEYHFINTINYFDRNYLYFD